MRVKSFRVKNYKSIKDSGVCYAQPDITILAGKNESGKTALLQALRDFGKDVETVSIDAVRNKDSEDSEPIEIEITFGLTAAEVEKFILSIETCVSLDNTKQSECSDYILRYGLVVIKTFNEAGVGAYKLGNEVTQLLDKYELDEIPSPVSKLETQVQEFVSANEKFPLKLVKASNTTEGIEKQLQSINQQLNRYVLKGLNTEEKAIIVQLALQVKETLEGFEGYLPRTILLNDVILCLPAFIFFSDFEDLLPNEIDIESAEQHSAIKNFQSVTGFCVKTLKNKSKVNDRSTYCDKYSEKFSRHFNDEWHQAEVELKVRCDSNSLAFSIVETGSTNHYDIDVRSKGFQWFLAFYLMLDAIKAENKIILIDEPGLYLHEKAQKNVLNVLEKTIAPKSQILFSTHSPYLIHPNELQRVRLVLRNDENGTRVENSPHKSPDAESLAPIHTAIVEAIGHDPAHGISAQYKHNVILEGVSDYYFITAVAEITGEKTILSNAKLIPSTGASTTNLLASLFTGWGLDYVVLLDNDSAGRQAKTNIEKKCISPKVMLVPSEIEDKGQTLEDLFTIEDFRRYVLADTDLSQFTSTDSNSLIFDTLAKDKTHALNKALWSKLFYDRAKSRNIQLSEASITNFKTLFSDIKEQLCLLGSATAKPVQANSSKKSGFKRA